MKNTIVDSLVGILSSEFSKTVRTWTRPSELAEIVKRNKANANTEYKDCCASHDFIDANMAMFEAFKVVMKREPDFQAQADLDLFNDAWTLSKKVNFSN